MRLLSWKQSFGLNHMNLIDYCSWVSKMGFHINMILRDLRIWTIICNGGGVWLLMWIFMPCWNIYFVIRYCEWCVACVGSINVGTLHFMWIGDDMLCWDMSFGWVIVVMSKLS